MKLMKIYSLACALALVPVVGFAQGKAPVAESTAWSGDLKLSVGFSNRNFRQARFDSVAAPSLDGYLLDGKLVTLEEYKAAFPHLGSSTVVGQPPRMQEVTHTYFTGGATAGHDGYSASESTGLTLGASYGIYADDNIQLDVVANLSYFHIDAANGGSFGGSEKTQVGIIPENDYSVPPFIIDEQSSNYVKSSNVSKFDMKLWTIDLGLSVSYLFDNNLSVYLAAGPTLSLADMESSSFSSSYSVNNPGYNESRGGRDNEIEFEWGFYASAGVSYMFTESLGISAELRYDEAFGTVGTKYVTQDLDSWGGSVKMLFQF